MANEAGHQGVPGNVPKDYYKTLLEQAQQSLIWARIWAVIAAVVGLIFLLAAVRFILAQQSVEVAVISAVAGTIVEIISGLNFFLLYGQATKQLSRYQDSLDRTQRFLLAYSVCESLEGEERQKARSILVATILQTQGKGFP